MGYAKDKQFEEIVSKVEELKNGCEDKGKREKFFNLLLSISADTRKEFLKNYNEICEEVNKEISKTKEQIRKLKKAIKITRKSLNKIVDEEEKEDVKEKLQKIEGTLKETQKSVKEKVAEIKTELRKKEQYKIVKTHNTNKKVNWITCISLLLSILFVGFLRYDWIKIAYSVVIGVGSISLFVWKVYFVGKYISYGTSDIPSKIILYLSKLSTTILILLVFLYITVYTFTFSFPDFIGWILIAIIFVKVVVLLYDFFCSSGFYKDLQENIIWLYVSIILVITLFNPLIKNEIVFVIYKGFLIGVSLLLTALVLKRILLDIKNLKGYSEILYLIIICVLTVFLTVYAIYICCWVADSQSQPLFSAVTGIYAALIGGALTLGGVAWTIKKSDKDRKEDDKKKYRPIVNFFGARANQISGKFLINSDFEGSSSNLFINRADEATTYKIHNLICQNTDFSPFYLSGIIVNKVKFYSNVKIYIDKNDYLGFGFNTLLYSNKEIKYISLIVQDLLGNEYKIPIKFEVNGDDEKLIEIKDTGFACDIDTEECDERF